MKFVLAVVFIGLGCVPQRAIAASSSVRGGYVVTTDEVPPFDDKRKAPGAYHVVSGIDPVPKKTPALSSKSPGAHDFKFIDELDDILWPDGTEEATNDKAAASKNNQKAPGEAHDAAFIDTVFDILWPDGTFHNKASASDNKKAPEADDIDFIDTVRKAPASSNKSPGTPGVKDTVWPDSTEAATNGKAAASKDNQKAPTEAHGVEFVDNARDILWPDRNGAATFHDKVPTSDNKMALRGGHDVAFIDTAHNKAPLYHEDDPTWRNHRALRDGPACGVIGVPCAKGAVCVPDLTREGIPDWCFCNEPNGYSNDEDASYAPGVVEMNLQGYFACRSANECINQLGTTNVCAPSDEGGGCEDRDPDNGQYRCFCQQGYKPVNGSTGAHGPEACEKLGDDFDCSLEGNICAGEGKICVGTPGLCQCDVGLIETQNGECLDAPLIQNLTTCDPSTGDDCSEPERECNETLQKCVCVPGFFQPAGAGGQCLQVNECELQTDVACDQRARGGPNPRSKCIDRYPIDSNGKPRQGYTCECLPGFEDAPNTIKGTNCTEVPPDDPTSPSSVPSISPTNAPVASEAADTIPPVRPPPPPPCSTFNCPAFSTCIAKVNQCLCVRGHIQSLGSPFACEKRCGSNTDCLDNSFCFESRCTSCPVATPFREQSSTGDCVECLANIDCPADEVCENGSCAACSTETPFRVQSSTDGCVECLVNTNCLADQVCNNNTGSCTACPDGTPFRELLSPDGCVECLINPDCPANEVCDDGSCIACPSTAPFRPQSSSDGCVACVNTDCPANEVCDDGSCTACPIATPVRAQSSTDGCVECLVNTDCPVNEVCNDDSCTACPIATPFREQSSTDGCAECVLNTNCPEVNQACVASQCTGCPSGSFPAFPSGACVEPCSVVSGACTSRFVTTNFCNNGDTIPSATCTLFGLSEPIPDLGRFATTIEFLDPDPAACTISDVRVTVDIEHTFIGDLQIGLTHLRTGTSVVLWGDENGNGGPCGSSNDMQVTFSDAGTDFPVCGSPTTGTIKPVVETDNSFSNPLLSAFVGEEATGAWTLTLLDEIESDTGELKSWSIAIDCRA